MKKPIPLDIQASAAAIAAENYRGSLNRHEDLAQNKPHPKWNAELLPMERTRADELDAVAATMKWLAGSPRATELRAARSIEADAA